MRIGTRNLMWKDNELFRQGSRRPILSIEPDTTYPDMWRIRFPDGKLSDMANRTWAKDGALSVARQHLERQETASEVVYVRSLGLVATTHASSC